LTSLKAIVVQPTTGDSGGSSSGSSSSGATTAPNLETKQASTIVRMRNGTTVVLGGLIQTEEAKNLRKVPLLGDIPGLGKWLFTGTYKADKKRELVIFVTPRIIAPGETSVQSEFPSRVNPPKDL
jgi:type II secretory pathway component GspD/PulD (secretin)